MFGSRESKEEKQARKLTEAMKQLNLENLSDEDKETVKEIKTELMGTGLIRGGMALSFAKAEEQAKVGYLQALVKQNWVIIKKLDEIYKALNK